MKIYELQVLNSMKSIIVELEDHSHGVTTMRVDSYLTKVITSIEEVKRITFRELMGFIDEKVQ